MTTSLNHRTRMKVEPRQEMPQTAGCKARAPFVLSIYTFLSENRHEYRRSKVKLHLELKPPSDRPYTNRNFKYGRIRRLTAVTTNLCATVCEILPIFRKCYVKIKLRPKRRTITFFKLLFSRNVILSHFVPSFSKLTR